MDRWWSKLPSEHKTPEKGTFSRNPMPSLGPRGALERSIHSSSSFLGGFPREYLKFSSSVQVQDFGARPRHKGLSHPKVVHRLGLYVPTLLALMKF